MFTRSFNFPSKFQCQSNSRKLKKLIKNASNLKQTTQIRDGNRFSPTEAWELKAESLLIKFMQGSPSWQIYLPLGHQGLNTNFLYAQNAKIPHPTGPENTTIPQFGIKLPEIPQEKWSNTAIPPTPTSASSCELLL